MAVEEEFAAAGILRVVTESSVWFVSRDSYQRLPRAEAPRSPQPSIAGRLDDGHWHGLRRSWWVNHDDGVRQVRLLPEIGPVDGVGILTGVVLSVHGEWAAPGS